jgi:ketosteroid isomerase-like protein
MLAASSLLILAASFAGAQRGTPNPERTAVQQIVLSMAQHIQAGNIAAIDSLFTPRGHILTDTTTLHSWAEYRDGQLKAELARFTNLRFEHTAVEAQVRGTIAWIAFRQLISGTTPTGALQLSGRGTAVLEKSGGRWAIVHLHVSR